MEQLSLDNDLFKEIEKDLRPFIGKCIDISNPPLSFVEHLDKDYAASVGVSVKELSTKWLEKKIDEIAKRDGVALVTLVKAEVAGRPDVMMVLSQQSNRVILLT